MSLIIPYINRINITQKTNVSIVSCICGNTYTKETSTPAGGHKESTNIKRKLAKRLKLFDRTLFIHGQHQRDRRNTSNLVREENKKLKLKVIEI